MAFELKLPIIVHSRNADAETLEILSKAAKNPKFVGGIMHCFGGAPEVVPKLLDLGFLISFAGNVTFKKAENLRNAARLVPLDRILIETDCPYLTPEPLRGRRNEPAFVLHTASFLSSLFAVNVEDFARTTTRNFLRFFKLNNQ
jgi:TatD DNase family protein